LAANSFFSNEKIDKQWQYLLSPLVICVVAAVCFLCSSYITPEVVAFIFLLTLSVIAMFLDILPVLLAAGLSALIWDFFFLKPRFNFQVINTEDKMMLSMYFVIALINGVLTFKIRQIGKVAQQKEEKANAIKLYDALLNSLSHEFRTPIATIIGAADNLLSEPPKLTGNDKKNLLSEISVASLRLNQQVENLLNMSRLESGFIQPKKDWCDVNELICNVLHRLDHELKDHSVEIDIREDLPLFKMDYGLIEQVVYNLVNNASQYTSPESKILISADHENTGLTMIIEDNGNGFPEEEREKVFDKFYRLKNSPTGGTGLGLSIVRGFVEAHGGTVELKKGSLGGASFLVKIPREKNLA